jgi:transcriptional regulator with XRE-family HTH domain
VKDVSQTTLGSDVRPTGPWFEDLTGSALVDARVWMAARRSVSAISIVPPLIELFNAYLTAGRPAPIQLDPEFVAPELAIEPVVNDGSTAKAVRKAREDSGLTWEQLARVFSVSRRSVHLWANGARMNATNVEMLMDFVDLVNHMNAANPTARRAALLALGDDGQSVLDRFRSLYFSRRGSFKSEPRPESYLGALHGDVSE